MKHAETLQTPTSPRRRLPVYLVRNTQSLETTPLNLGLPKEKLLLTIPETADCLQVSVTTVRNMIDCGMLDAGHVGTFSNPKRQHLRVTRESMERLQLERFGR